MKKVAVIFEGKYGTTEQYARWICEETDGDLYRAGQCSVEKLTAYDVIVFGGAVHAGGILGMKNLKKMYPAIADRQGRTFAVGLSVDDPAIQRQCHEVNFEKQPSGFKQLLHLPVRMTETEERFSRLPCWFFRGAYDPEKVSGTDKAMMSVVKKMIEGKRESDRTEAEKELLNAITNGADYVQRSCIAPLIKEIKG